MDAIESFADQHSRTRTENPKPQKLMTCSPDVTVCMLFDELRWSKLDIDKVQELILDEGQSLDSECLALGFKERLSLYVKILIVRERSPATSPC
ncbi:hypothetical protein BDV29DRAFT_185797 [Aspergillus leporis]|jgi:hypothetical protein|uniref:Uncharacterized protein n=1 Tax=Aspergillus leporis TaxID=41062 RepID=A0A5N5WGW2_9EURO|nr:hypothetical protein BDV29DRAFT_185797 [Aspergillus leporis]